AKRFVEASVKPVDPVKAPKWQRLVPQPAPAPQPHPRRRSLRSDLRGGAQLPASLLLQPLGDQTHVLDAGRSGHQRGIGRRYYGDALKADGCHEMTVAADVGVVAIMRDDIAYDDVAAGICVT